MSTTSYAYLVLEEISDRYIAIFILSKAIATDLCSEPTDLCSEPADYFGKA
ncbi:MAG: hypothetical protein RMY29_018525 [Nostoc sp. CreGUA01]|nr:hypothetical protein [Nostoc sp. CreGUA01]